MHYIEFKLVTYIHAIVINLFTLSNTYKKPRRRRGKKKKKKARKGKEREIFF